MVEDKHVLKVLHLLGGDVYFKATSPGRSVKIILNKKLLKFLKECGIHSNSLINKLVHTDTRVKKAYLEDKHPNFISLSSVDGELMLNYLTIDSVKKIIRDFLQDKPKSYIEELSLKHMNRFSIPTKVYELYDLFRSSTEHRVMSGTSSSVYISFEKAKIGKGIRKLFNKKEPKEIEQFVDLVKTTVESNENYDIDIVNGQEIQFYYHENQYSNNMKDSNPISNIEERHDHQPMVAMVNGGLEGCGELGNSCMRYGNCSSGIKFYSSNPETISMLILRANKNKSKILARALLWEGIDGKMYVDRIYGVNNTAHLALASYTRKNNYINISESNKKILPYDTSLLIKVKLSKWSDMDLPYFDSMRYINIQEGIITNFIYNDKHNFIKTSGGTFLENGLIKPITRVKCCITNETIDKNDAIFLTYGKHKNQWCSKEKTAFIRYMDTFITEEEVTKENYVIGKCRLGKTLIPLEDAVISTCLNDYIPLSEAIYVPQEDDYVLSYEDIFLDKKVTIAKNLEDICKRENVAFADVMKLMIVEPPNKHTVKKDMMGPKGVFISDYFIPYSALNLAK